MARTAIRRFRFRSAVFNKTEKGERSYLASLWYVQLHIVMCYLLINTFSMLFLRMSQIGQLSIKCFE